MYSRLGGMGLVYAGTWLAVFLYFQTIKHLREQPDRELFWNLTTALCMGTGVAVYLLCRKRKIPPRLFVAVDATTRSGALTALAVRTIALASTAVNLGRTRSVD